MSVLENSIFVLDVIKCKKKEQFNGSIAFNALETGRIIYQMEVMSNQKKGIKSFLKLI